MPLSKQKFTKCSKNIILCLCVSRMCEHLHIESKKPDVVPVAKKHKIGFHVDAKTDIGDNSLSNTKKDIKKPPIVIWLCMKKFGINNTRLGLFADAPLEKGAFIGLCMGGSDGLEPHCMKPGWAGAEVIAC